MDWGSSLDCVTFAIMEHLAEMFCKRNIKVQIENKLQPLVGLHLFPRSGDFKILAP